MAKLLYFAVLTDRLGQTSEDVTLPAQVGDVRSLLAWLRTRGGPWGTVARGQRRARDRQTRGTSLYHSSTTLH